MRNYLIIFFLVFSKVSFGQKYLNDTTLLTSNACLFIAPYESDSGIYVASMGIFEGHGNMTHLLLAYYDSLGNHSIVLNDFDTNNIQNLNSTVSDLIYNDRGNFVYYFKNCDINKCYTRIKEITPSGQTVADVKLDTLASGLVDYNDFLQKSYDSSYVMTLNSYDGLIFVHLDKNFNKISVLYYNASSPWGYANTNLVEGENGEIILNMSHRKAAATVNQQANVVMKRLDKNDVELDSKIYSDGPKISLPLGLCRGKEGSYFFTYTREQLENNYWYSYYYLCKLDEEFNLVWKTKLEPILISSLSQFSLQQQIIATLDDNYVVVGAFTAPESVPGGHISASVLRKFSEQGEILWQRYIYIPKGSSTSVGIEIKNVIATKDSGYCMVGNRTDHTVINNGGLGQKGYIVKTNCLGYLSGPTAAATHQIKDEFNVEFVNVSTQARDYTWDFGDGTFLTTVSLDDTINHTYSGFGIYEVVLIANGCNGENDTLKFIVEPKKHEDPSVVTNGNGYFSIFPNPVLEGQDLYIYLNSMNPQNGDVYIVLHNLQGEEVQRFELSTEEGSYLLGEQLSSGMYMVSLFQGNELIQNRKLIIN